MKKFLYNYILTPMLIALGTLWFKSLRIECENPEVVQNLRRSHRPHIITCWHQHLILVFYYLRGWRDLTILISPSADGDIAARLCQWLGFQTVRGSSFKQPLASSRALLQALKKNRKVAVIADGSRGPRHKVQSGILRLSQISGATYSACSWDARWKYQFNSWDQFLLPLPFSHCRIRFGPPDTVPRSADATLLEAKARELEASLNRLQKEVAWG